MTSRRETIVAARYVRLSEFRATALRGGVLPERVPVAGLVVLRDGEPEVTLSPRATILSTGPRPAGRAECRA